MTTLYQTIVQTLKQDSRFFTEDNSALLTEVVSKAALTNDANLIHLLLGNDCTKASFFKDVNGALIFDKEDFILAIDNQANPCQTAHEHACECSNKEEIQNGAENKCKRKLLHIEFIRVFAILLVIFTHGELRGSYAYLQYWPASGFINGIWEVLWTCMFHICRVAVPLFLMVSGALLLNKKESLLTLYKKRIFRFFLLIILFIPVAYLIYFSLCKGFVFPSIAELVRLTLSFNLTPETRGPFVTLWFLYIYLAFLIMLPLLRSMVVSLDRKLYWYLVSCALVAHAVLPVVLFFISGTSSDLYINSFLVLCENVVFFPLLGYFLERVLPLSFWSRRKLAFLTITSILFIAVAVFCTLLKQREMPLGVPACSFLSVSVIPLCILFYVLVKKLFIWAPNIGFLNKTLCTLGRLAFAIYLLESTVRLRVVLPMLDRLTGCDLPPFVECTVLVLGTYAISACVACVIIKIPYMKKLF